MTWPTPQDYNEAVQDPAFCFSDPDLKRGTPELTALGLPRPVTGNFACVYRLTSSNKDWAVRCFLQEHADQQRRYAAISQHLASNHLPYIVPFQFLEQGIRIRNRWYPVLKMEWVHGQTLNAFIESNLKDKQVLLKLASDWIEMIHALQSTGIAHGDLQHGNVLITNRQLRIIDYDGMYVPSLASMSSHEIGHRNYQHPKRTSKDFDLFIDGFAAWVIYVSLNILAADPALRRDFSASDEFILFEKKDFEAPDDSKRIAQLLGHPDSHIREVATRFRSVLDLDIRDVPILDGRADRLPAPHHGTSEQNTQLPDRPGGSLPNLAGMFWIIDHISPEPSTRPESFGSRPRLARVVGIIIIAGTPLLVALTLAAGIPAPILLLIPFPLMLAVLISYAHYLGETPVREKRDAARRLGDATHQKTTAEKVVADFPRKRDAARRTLLDNRAALGKERVRLQVTKRKRVDRATATTRRKARLTEANRKRLVGRRDGEINRIRVPYTRAINRISSQIVRLDQDESKEMDTALRAMHKEFVKAYLESASISFAPFPGSGRGNSQSSLVDALIGHGIRTAYDVSYSRVDAVYGFGPVRTSALVAWREHLYNKAISQLPKSLDPNRRASIAVGYGAKRARLERERDENHQKLSEQEVVIQQRYDLAIQSASSEIQALSQKECRLKNDVSLSMASEYEKIDERNVAREKVYDEYLLLLEREERESRMALFSARWQLTGIWSEYASFRRITFLNYLRS